MFGVSYSAWVQASAATQAPPHLAAMLQVFGGTHGYYSARQGGALDLFWLSFWVLMAASGKEAQADPVVQEALAGMSYADWLKRWPLRKGRSPLALARSYEQLYFDFVSHETLDEYWRRPGLSPAEQPERWPDVPTLWVCGWFDWYQYAHPDTLLWERLRRLGHRNQYLVFGPWVHEGSEPSGNTGQVTFGPRSTMQAALPDYALRWFDRWLKDIDDEGLFQDQTRIFMMGGGSGRKSCDGLLEHGGSWTAMTGWPPEQSVEQILYLHAGGRLTAEIPTDSPASSSYRANPADPAPTSTGVCYTASLERGRNRHARRLESGGGATSI
jgi:hypothetical protein